REAPHRTGGGSGHARRDGAPGRAVRGGCGTRRLAVQATHRVGNRLRGPRRRAVSCLGRRSHHASPCHGERPTGGAGLNTAAGGTESGRLRGRDPILERIPATRNLAYRARYLVNAYPALYMPMGRFRHRHSSDYCVGPGTEIVIEGFGRAGSTFAWLAFMSAQDRPVRTAHHTHAAAQVITAVRLGKPTLVIVRPPTDATLAHMARKGITARMALVAWTRFH